MHYFIIRTRGHRTTPLRVKEDIEDVCAELGNGGSRLPFLDETSRTLLFSSNKSNNESHNTLQKIVDIHCKEPLPAPGNRSNERRYKEKDLATTEEKGRNGGEERVKKKAGVVKSRHGWTMYLNLVTSQYILDFKKCPIEGME
ncbi:hypothetical protein TNCV_2902991 [Trichonephila clavipes]|nr:hypothetical protein TNCV_2902991 [Trichonephila clavipes]